MLIAQITDAHIVPKGTHWKGEPATEIPDRLTRAVACLNSLDPQPDAIVFTGDATDNGDRESYSYFRELMEPLKAPYFVLPGNHDDRSEMRRCFQDAEYLPASGFMNYTVERFPVRLIALDTTVEGAGYGQVCEERLDWLEKALGKGPGKPSFLLMHHPPVKVGAKAFDTSYSCLFSPRLEELIRKSSLLLGIAAGHFHHLCVSSFGGKTCFLAPSLAPTHYFAHPEDADPTALELDEPAVTLHKYLGAGSLSTRVIRLKVDYRRIGWERIRELAPTLQRQ